MKQVRGERLVDKVLDATLEELSVKGFGALSVEEVAARAQVNKTTIYRRWPTKVDLARAALLTIGRDVIRVADTGDLRVDLRVTLRSFRDFVKTPRGRGLFRMTLGEGDSSAITAIARDVREELGNRPRDMILRAIKRGELPAATDPELVFEMLVASVQHHLVFLKVPCDDARIDQMIEIVLCGAATSKARPGAPSGRSRASSSSSTSSAPRRSRRTSSRGTR